jgi:N6-adenosine-specific RNA methylase IME4
MLPVMSKVQTYKVLVADPPWRLADQLPGNGRGAGKHYDLLSFAEIEAFSLPLLAEDAMLFLWRLASAGEEAYKVMRAWGFTPKTELIWKKLTPTGKRWFGMGRYLRAEHETCLVGIKGRPGQIREEMLSWSIRSVFEAPAGRHSAKPDAFYSLVESIHPGPYVELFARRTRPGWTCLGNEIV